MVRQGEVSVVGLLSVELGVDAEGPALYPAQS